MEVFSCVIHNFFLKLLQITESIFLIKVLGLPIIILWIVVLILFCNLRFNFIHIRLFAHTITILTNNKNYAETNGIISHLQAFFTSISGTIGLGTISGVAIAITTGGPSSILWMAIIGILSMPVKFAEVTLAFKYRNDKSNFSGPFQYMKYGLQEIGLNKLGRVLSYIYAIALIISMSFGGIPLQANQVVKLSYSLFTSIDKTVISSLLTLLIGLVIMGGIKRIAMVNIKIMPITVPLYILGCLIIIVKNIDRVPETIHIIFHDMMNYSNIKGGLLGSFIVGVRRAIFANEAGIGTSAIAHASTNETKAVRVGCVAMIEPCIDTVIISFFTGFVIIIVHPYPSSLSGDIVLASSSFLTISPMFGYFIFPIIVFSFAFSTIITYSYYCESSWRHIFGNNVILCRVLVMLLVFISCLSNDISSIAQLGDILYMILTIPNAIAIFLLNNKLREEIKKYLYEK